MKVILHLDLDSYFVSAERTVDPNLIGKPVVISSGERRSIISAASYEAKEKGVYVPMPFYKAKEIVPDLIFVNSDFALYTTLSNRLFELLSNNITNKIEVASIDECYMDATDIWKKYETPYKLAKYIQELVFKELKLPISIGISSTKFVAKMSTQINKPLGITITKPGNFKEVFKDWETSSIHGVGQPTSSILSKDKINTIGELIDTPKERIISLLGKRGIELHNNIHEQGSDEIDTEMNDLKGIGNSITFMERDKFERQDILDVLKHLCGTVSVRLNNRNMAGKVLSVGIKEVGGKEVKTKTKQITLPREIRTHDEIFSNASSIFDSMWKEEPIKFISVHITRLVEIFDSSFQQSIFDTFPEKDNTEKIIHNINKQLGDKVLKTGKEVFLDQKKKNNQSRFLESDRIVKRYKKQD